MQRPVVETSRTTSTSRRAGSSVTACVAHAIAAVGADVRRWASDNDWPLDRRVEMERTIQWWAFDLV